MRAVVVVPTYNEAENIGVLAEHLLALEPPLDVLVVDDGSPDGTAEVAERAGGDTGRVRVLRRTGPRGYAGSCRDGMLQASREGYDLVLTMDADLSHDPDVIPGMLGRIEDGADMVIGSRYCPGGGLDAPHWGPVRLAVSKVGSAYARTAVGTPVRDCTSGFRCYRREAVDKLDLSAVRSEGYCFLIEVLDRATRLGLRVDEVPITYVDRIAGRSKISRRIILEALLRTTAIGGRRLVGR